MSNTLREYDSITRGFDNTKRMWVTATVQGEYGAGIQITVGNEYCVLAENQVRDLIKILKKRMSCEKGYSATDTLGEIIISPEKQNEVTIPASSQL